MGKFNGISPWGISATGKNAAGVAALLLFIDLILFSVFDKYFFQNKRTFDINTPTLTIP